MIRFRRYRVFVVGALILLLLLFRVAQNSQWELDRATTAVYDSVHKGTKNSKSTKEKLHVSTPDAPPIARKQPAAGIQHEQGRDDAPRQLMVDIPKLKDESTKAGKPGATKPLVAAGGAGGSREDANNPTVPERDSEQHPMGHNRLPSSMKNGDKPAAKSTNYRQHWKKHPEHNPIPDDKVIPLPTGKPKAIPKIQHQFGKESTAAKEKREARLEQVKIETKRAWDSYRKYAWGHDEIEPIALAPRDPFCGWAATLVDSLDTLWIMGLKDEFEDAYKALDNIDFTTTDRSEIPVFETIIRYMGGLLAAYDVSGGKQGRHHKLLQKVEELATVLMSVFDTPNRMPILYYQWMPQEASRSLRASSSVSVAELGSLSMEFTRLAQLTGNNRYYDAIARITDAFEEWQNRGTTLDGIFPQQIDASGCNRTALPVTHQLVDETDLGTPAIGPPEAPRGKDKATAGESGPHGLHPRAASIAGASAASGSAPKDSEKETVGIPSVPQPRADVYDRDTTANHFGAVPPPQDDCRPQGLTATSPEYGQYGMGGSQDSTYEYFPKQYLLLGGLVDKYKTMHEKTVAAVKKYLLYRPMIKEEDRTLLFSAKVHTRGKELKYKYEVTHLTCFLGGMFALGGKIFNSEEDVVIGAQLADGCVWAYESMGSGIMPETSDVVPCQTVESCPWNETVWHDHLDPNSEWRARQAADYAESKLEWDQMYANVARKHKESTDAEWEAKKARVAGTAPPATDSKDGKGKVIGGSSAPSPGNSVLDGAGPGVRPGAARISEDEPEKVFSGEDTKSSLKIERSDEDTSGSWRAARSKGRAAGRSYGTNPAMVGAEDAIGGVRSSITISDVNSHQSPLRNPLWDLPPEPTKPLTHEEYVTERIKSERIPPGFTSLIDKRYILRPEAIESVWYMYRITGDPIWQEKGWQMWLSVLAATRTRESYSAIEDVTTSSPEWTNNMESFWVAETLKYFYLLFSTPDVISLDDWVLNTEAHPFRRPTA